TTDADRAQLKNVMARKRRSEKITREYARTAQAPTTDEALRDLAAGVQVQAESRGAQPVHRATGNNIVRMTQMDEVVAQEQEQRRTGTYDLSSIAPAEPVRRKIHLFESDKPTEE